MELHEKGVDLEQEHDTAGFLRLHPEKNTETNFLEMKQTGLIDQIIKMLGLSIGTLSIKAMPDENNPLVIRNKISLKYKVNKKISPYTAYEFYYQINNENSINRTRISLGSSFKTTDNTALKVFYMFENRFNVKNLKHNHVYGISYSIEL